MTGTLASVSEVELAMLIARGHVIRKVAQGSDILIGEAPYSGKVLDQAWASVVEYPLPEEHFDWIIGSFGGLLIDHLRFQYGCEAKSLTDEHGTSICMVEPKTGAQLFPFDMIHRRVHEQKHDFFEPLLLGIQASLEPHGVRPRSAASAPPKANNPQQPKNWLSRLLGK